VRTRVTAAKAAHNNGEGRSQQRRRPLTTTAKAARIKAGRPCPVQVATIVRFFHRYLNRARVISGCSG